MNFVSKLCDDSFDANAFTAFLSDGDAKLRVPVLRHMHRLRNVVFRIVGIWFTVPGGIALLAGIVGCVRWAVGAKTAPIEEAVTQTIVTAVVTTLGIGILRARPYRPDLGDEAFLGMFKRRPAPNDPRKWWTGDPK